MKKLHSAEVKMNLKTSSSSSHSELRNPNNGDESQPYFEDFESACSTPYVSAPSSPGRGSSSSAPAAVSGGFFYSAPASPIHFVLSSNSSKHGGSSKEDGTVPMGYEFDFSARFGPVQPGSMSSADELFLNGKIRPMKLSTHLERPQALAPMADLDNDDEEEEEEEDEGNGGGRGRDLRIRDKSVRRRTRSMSPMRNSAPAFEWIESEKAKEEEDNNGGLIKGLNNMNSSTSSSSSSSRSSSAGRNSKRWLFLKEFLRSKSEGRSNNKYFWSNIAAKEKKPNGGEENGPARKPAIVTARTKPSNGVVEKNKNKKEKKKTYEMHYTTNRAQMEEMRKKTYLPYRQGLLGCLGFSSKGYGAVNGLARALNPVSSR